jgi:hypothetical protein
MGIKGIRNLLEENNNVGSLFRPVGLRENWIFSFPTKASTLQF